MLTEAQQIIVKEICSIQFISLKDILISVNLGTNDEGESYEEIMDDLGFGRKEFDIQLIKTIRKFEEIQKDPELLYELDELDILVFKHILHNFRHKWENKYPKAMENLWNKLFLWSITNELYNKQ